MVRSIFTAMCMLLVTAAVTFAQTTQPIANPIHRAAGGAVTTTQPASAGSLDMGQVVIALAAVLGLILLLRIAIRKIAPGAMGKSTRGIQLLSRTYLGPKRQLLVLQVGRRLLVVADSGQAMNTLCEITDPDEVAMLTSQTGGKRVDSDSFATAMKRANDDFATSAQASTPTDPVLDSARTELNGLAQRVRILAKQLNQT